MSDTRFEFGQNWTDFATKIDDKKIAIAMASVRHLLNTDDLKGKSFLDIGCGSGLFSVAAAKLGAEVHAFDYDEYSVRCTRCLKMQTGTDFSLQRGAILDDDFVQNLGTYDYVYSWGVLHHTGDMHKALVNAVKCVKSGGLIALFIMIKAGCRNYGRRLSEPITVCQSH